MSKVPEILDLLQEECGELVQVISKVRRFGLEGKHPTGCPQRDVLIQELGDVTLLIELLHAHGLYTEKQLRTAQRYKAEKLTKWSTIYED